MDLVGGLIYRAGKISVPARANLQWRRSRRTDFALVLVDRLPIRGTTVVDAGAGWGLFTNRMARRVGRGGTVHAFEPQPAHASSLAAIAKRHPQVTLHSTALSDRSGETGLRVPTIAGNAIIDMGTLTETELEVGNEITVRTARLDEVVDGPVSFIKIDVEGHELAVLKGAESLLNGDTTLLVEVEQRHHKQPITEVLDRLADYGTVEAVFPDGARPLTAFDPYRDQVQMLEGKTSPADDELPEYVKDFLVRP